MSLAFRGFELRNCAIPFVSKRSTTAWTVLSLIERHPAMIDGWIQADVECNPLLGPQVMELALKLMNGETVEKEALTNETVFFPDNAAELLPTRQY